MRSIAQKATEPTQPQPALVRASKLRKAASALDAVGVLLLELADEAEDLVEADPRLTVAQAAAELGFSETHIKSACKRGLIVATKAGGWRMRRSALLDYERRLQRGVEARSKGKGAAA